eukprot:gene11894-15912_t
MSVFTPVNQVRLTNVAYVRLTKNHKRFEIACYRNKVLNWRNKIETDINEVLQIDSIFSNVSKGMLANSKDLLAIFGTTDSKIICQEILDKGELQVSEQERDALYESVFRDVANIIADKTVNPENNRPYTVSMIQNAMKQIQYAVNVSKSAKSQALDVIRKLRDVMPIARASMLLRIVCMIHNEADLQSIRLKIIDLGGVITNESTENIVDNTENNITISSELTASSEENNNKMKKKPASIEFRIDPEGFRKVEEIVSEGVIDGLQSRLEVIQLRVAATVSTAMQINKPSPTTQSSVIIATNNNNKSNKSSKSSEKNQKLIQSIEEMNGNNIIESVEKLSFFETQNNKEENNSKFDTLLFSTNKSSNLNELMLLDDDSSEEEFEDDNDGDEECDPLSEGDFSEYVLTSKSVGNDNQNNDNINNDNNHNNNNIENNNIQTCVGTFIKAKGKGKLRTRSVNLLEKVKPVAVAFAAVLTMNALEPDEGMDEIEPLHTDDEGYIIVQPIQPIPGDDDNHDNNNNNNNESEENNDNNAQFGIMDNGIHVLHEINDNNIQSHHNNNSILNNTNNDITNKPVNNGNKKSKKNKRIEKEEQKQRQIRSQLAKDRIDRDYSSISSHTNHANKYNNNNNDNNNSTSNDITSNNTISNNIIVQKTDNNNISVENNNEIINLPSQASTGAPEKKSGQSCNTCGGDFIDAKEYRNHFKSEWHRCNLKRKMKNLPIITSEELFEKINNESDLLQIDLI